MELNLSGEWKTFLDTKSIGERDQWFSPGNFPGAAKTAHLPAFSLHRPYVNVKTVWFEKEFEFSPEESESFIYLVFFFADRAKIWLNGEYVGQMKRTTKKQNFDITNFIKEKNTLTIKFEALTEFSVCLPGRIYVIENSMTPQISKQMITHTPKWVNSAVIYSCYVRNFSKEGTFKAVEERLDDIIATGANVLWLLPIHPIGKVKRKGNLGSPYAIADYYGVNPEFGNKDDLRSLIDQAHRKGLKVIFDLVINHTAHDSVLMKEHPDYFKPKDQQMAAAWGWDDVVDLDYSNPGTFSYIKEMMLYWQREFKIDGYRCDVAMLVPWDFWKDSIAALRENNPETLMLAESDHAEMFTCGFDLIYDWNFRYVMEGIDNGYYPLTEIGEYIKNQNSYCPFNSRRMIFLENHDISRSADVFRSSKLPVYETIKYMSSGIPLIYNGEEIGATKLPDLFDKDPIDWENKNLHFMEELAKLKEMKNYRAMNYQSPDGFDTSTPTGFYRIARYGLGQNVEAIFELYQRTSVSFYVDNELVSSLKEL